MVLYNYLINERRWKNHKKPAYQANARRFVPTEKVLKIIDNLATFSQRNRFPESYYLERKRR